MELLELDTGPTQCYRLQCEEDGVANACRQGQRGGMIVGEIPDVQFRPSELNVRERNPAIGRPRSAILE